MGPADACRGHEAAVALSAPLRDSNTLYCARPQPNFGPLSCKLLRSTSSSGVSCREILYVNGALIQFERLIMRYRVICVTVCFH